jgi:hypothetical protein
MADRISTTRVGTSVWILRPESGLERIALEELRRAFRRTLAQGARDVVIDLGSALAFGTDAAAALGAMADAMIAHEGVRWISVPWPGGDGFTLKPIRNSGVEGLEDVGSVLGRAAGERSGGTSDELGRHRPRDGGFDERNDTREEI